jgi:hypothetical protein
MYKKLDSDKINIPDNEPVTMKFCGNIIEVINVDRRNDRAQIKKISADLYINLNEGTGEVHQFKRGETRLDDTQSVKRSLSELRDYINTNVEDINKCRWLTLTYAENMTEPKRLKDDFKRFNRHCRRKYGHYEYITAAEPQNRSAWHLHAVLIFADTAPFMKNSDVRDLWGKGFVKVQKLTDVDNIGLYLTAYLSDLPLDDFGNAKHIKSCDMKNLEIISDDGERKTKVFVKGARLKMYPRGFHIHRESRGIKKPVKEVMTNANAAKITKDFKLIYENTVEMTDSERAFTLLINKRVYNKNLNAKTFFRKGGNDNDNKTENADNR